MTARAVGAEGRVVGVDRTPIDPPLDLANAVALSGDFAEPPVLEAVLGELGGLADVLLCDAAPKLSGVRATDRAREEQLLEAAAAALPRLLRPGGTLVLKLLESPEAQAAARELRRLFERAKTLVPEATRRGSSERYLVARGYRGARP